MTSNGNASVTCYSSTPVVCSLQDSLWGDDRDEQWCLKYVLESQQRKRRRRRQRWFGSQLSLFLIGAGAIYVRGFSYFHSPSRKVSTSKAAMGRVGIAQLLGTSQSRSYLLPRERRKGREAAGLDKWRYASVTSSGMSPLSYRNLGTDEATTTAPAPKGSNGEDFWERLFGHSKKDDNDDREEVDELYFIVDEDDDYQSKDGKISTKMARREEREERRTRIRIVAEWRKDKKRRRKAERKREKAQRRQQRRELKSMKKLREEEEDDDATFIYSGRRMTQEEFEEQRARLEYAMRYTDVSTLRSVFGTNRNRFWGDLDVERSRKLYRILLPRLLLALYELGYYDPDILAPLAYHTRKAAKQYARERCSVPGRILAMAYDGFRSWRDYGTFSVEGLTWEQLWAKYERQVLDEHTETNSEEEEEPSVDDDMKAQIYLRILKRSCVTNEQIDALILGQELFENKRKDPGNVTNHKYEVQAVAQRLEREVRRVILEDDEDDDERSSSGSASSSRKLGLLVPHVVTTVINSARQRVVMSFKDAFDEMEAPQQLPLVFFQPPPLRPLLPVEVAALKIMSPSAHRRLGVQP